MLSIWLPSLVSRPVLFFDKSLSYIYSILFYLILIVNSQIKGKRDKTRANKESGDRIVGSGLIGGDFTITPNPKYIDNRLQIFDRLLGEYQSRVSSKADIPISIILPNGDVKEGFAFKTTPMEIAKSISTGLADAIIIAKVVYSNKFDDDLIVACDEDEEQAAAQDTSETVNDGELWDLTRPLIGNCTLTLLKYDDTETKTVT